MLRIGDVVKIKSKSVGRNLKFLEYDEGIIVKICKKGEYTYSPFRKYEVVCVIGSNERLYKECLNLSVEEMESMSFDSDWFLKKDLVKKSNYIDDIDDVFDDIILSL